MGSFNINYPSIVSPELAPLKSWLFQLTDSLNLADFSANKIFSEAAAAIDSDGKNEALADTSKLSEYAALKSLIIKTGDYAIANGNADKLLDLSSSYVAISDFGKYTEDLNMTVIADSTGINNLFDYTSGINNDDGYNGGVTTKQYIKTGLLFYNSGVPKYGVGVGVLNTELTSGNETIKLSSGQLATFTSDELAFWSQGTKTAYITAGAINFPAANITGGSINIGSGTFKVTSSGALTATSATISGNITATSGTIGGCSISGGVLQIGSANIGTISANKISGGTLDFDYISVSNLSVTNAQIDSLNVSKLTSGTNTSLYMYGVELRGASNSYCVFGTLNTSMSRPAYDIETSAESSTINVGSGFITQGTVSLVGSAAYNARITYSGITFKNGGASQTITWQKIYDKCF